jgi:hypothetical protein
MSKADEDAIRQIELRFDAAWGRHDADGMVESLADDAQFVTVNGAWTKTRAKYLNFNAAPPRLQSAISGQYPRDPNHACAASSSRRGDDALPTPHLC